MCMIPGLSTYPAVVQMKEIVQEILPYTALVYAQEICVCPEIGQLHDICLIDPLSRTIPTPVLLQEISLFFQC